MAFKYRARVQEHWAGTGPGNVVPAGVPDSTYQAFASVLADADLTNIVIYGAGDFESCAATWSTSGGGHLVRGYVYESTNAGARVSFGAGAKTVLMTHPSRLVEGLRAATFDSYASAQAGVVGPGCVLIMLSNYYTSLVGGRGFWTKMAAAPGTPKKYHLQTADGYWFLYSPTDRFNVKAIGAKGDNSQDEAAYFDDIIALAAGRKIYAPGGLAGYRFDRPLTAYAGVVNIEGDGNGQSTSPGTIFNTWATTFFKNYDSATYLFAIDHAAPMVFEGILFQQVGTPTAGGALSFTCSTGGLGASPSIRACAFTLLWNGISLTKASNCEINCRNVFNQVRNRAVEILVGGSFEGGGGSIEDNIVIGYTGPFGPTVCGFFSQSGYSKINRNYIVGCKTAIDLDVTNTSAGAWEIIQNQIEEAVDWSVRIRRNGVSDSTAMPQIRLNEFSNLTQTGLIAHVEVSDAIAGDWADTIEITDNIARSVLGNYGARVLEGSNSGCYFRCNSGSGVTMDRNSIYHAGAGTAVAFEAKGAYVKAPAFVRNNRFGGTGTLGKRYDVAATVVVHDSSIPRAFLPATCAPGSFAFVTDGAPGTSPVAAGAGTFAGYYGGAWHGDLGSTINGITFTGAGSAFNVDGGKTGRFSNTITFTATADGYTVNFTGPGDVPTKSYVDNLVNGKKWKDSVLVRTTANITLSGEQTIDGVLTSGSRVLAMNQTTGSENGIYVSAAGAWSRAADADSGAELVSATVFVEQGTTYADTEWTCTNNAITLGSTSIAFVQTGGPGLYTNGTGISLTGNVFAIDSTVMTLAGVQTATNKTFTSPTINGGTATALTSFSLRSSGAAFNVTIASAEGLTGNRTLFLHLFDADRALALAGNFTTNSTLNLPAATALGEMWYVSAANILLAVAPNTTATKKFWRMTGTGTVGAAPAWDTVTSADVGLGNVDNTSNATERAAAAVLQNKTIDYRSNTVLGIAMLAAMAAHNVARNGACNVSMELGTTGASLTNNTAKYTGDMLEAMYNHGAATAVVTSGVVAAASFGATLARFTHGHRIKATTAITAPANGDFAKHRIKAEGYDVAHWGWGATGAASIVVAFQFYSTAAGTALARLSNAAGNRFYHHEVTCAAGWNFVAFNVVGDLTGTWAVDNTAGLVLELFSSGKETTPGATLDGWTATGKIQTTNSGNLLGTNNNETVLTGLYIDIGTQLPSAADLPDLMRPYGEAKRLCRRYYEKTYRDDVGDNVAVGTSGSTQNLYVNSVPSNTIGADQQFSSIPMVPKRSHTPTVTVYGYSGTSGTVATDGGTDLAAGSGTVFWKGQDRFTIYQHSGGSVTTTGFAVLFHWQAVDRL